MQPPWEPTRWEWLWQTPQGTCWNLPVQNCEILWVQKSSNACRPVSSEVSRKYGVVVVAMNGCNKGKWRWETAWIMLLWLLSLHPPIPPIPFPLLLFLLQFSVFLFLFFVVFLDYRSARVNRLLRLSIYKIASKIETPLFENGWLSVPMSDGSQRRRLVCA